MSQTQILSGAFLTVSMLALSSGAKAQDEQDEDVFPVSQDQIVVTASPLERSAGETIIGTSVISREELQRNLENSIGETLRREPGVSSTFFGPGASRPVIRGLGGDRIRVLDAGIGSIDASSTSPDHAVAVEPATAQKIEIVRGAGTLLYGSSAAGGVVNVFSGRIPTAVPEDGFDGAIRVGGSTADNGFETAGGFDIDLGPKGEGDLVFHGEGFYREAEIYDIPGFAESAVLRALEEAEAGPGEEPEEETFGVVENTDFTTKGGSAGLSYIFENGFFGISGTLIDTNYGVPGAHGHEEEGAEEEEEEGGVRIDLKQRRIDLHSEIDADFAWFRKTKIRLGVADYKHAEVEPSGEIGTLFSNKGWEGRLELVEKSFNALSGKVDGAVGVQFQLREFSAVGEEAFVPPTDTTRVGVFALKELTRGNLRFDLGGRYEHTSHKAPTTGQQREFDAFSVSGGIGATPSENVFLGVTAFRTERAPATEELFSNGPHLATNAFELGDADLNEEVARGLEGTVRISGDRVSAVINGFYTSYKRFIFETPTGAEMDELPVFQFVASDASFHGFEAQVEAELYRLGNFDLHGDAAVDYVRATSSGAGDNDLPRIPPLSSVIGLEARSDFIDIRGELELAASQNNTSSFELPTDGYQMVHAFVTLRPFKALQGLTFRLAANNLTNEEARLHTSFLKDLAPLPGRNFKFSLEGAF